LIIDWTTFAVNDFYVYAGLRMIDALQIEIECE